ncbi:MAG: alpha-ketoacid dehydrogenase subunit beta [Candidatus Eremiobacteraeota bacterium]|nr:alpha-ketoacid dehydrogenase subunit beta [Candidatus Eremiobacteraeota bacterium]MCL5054745.1 alpha-ketoacid dehydrogenase subunit beta [Bacillota bacterium]
MPVYNLLQALNDALRTAMRKNDRIVILGEDVGKLGGVFRVTKDLQTEFGPDRVIDTPLAEGGIIGTAIGMALYGLRPIAEIQFSDFIYPAFDQIVNELAKYRYRSGGQYECPVIIRTPSGGGIKGGLYHSQSPEAYFIHTPGLKVLMPSNPYDAKGLLLSALDQNDPVIFFEPKRIYRSAKGEVPESEYSVPIGKAEVVKQGKDVTLISYGAMMTESREAVEKALEEGVQVELIDLKSLVPLDVETVIGSVQKTGKVVIVNEAPRTCGFAAELVALINEKAFLYLEAPPVRVTGFDTPFPYTLEHVYLPSVDRILKAIRQTAHF